MDANEPAVSSAVVAAFVATTKEAKLALGGRDEVPIMRFPFTVGRESRGTAHEAVLFLTELRLDTAPKSNDLYLFEPPWADLSQISRDHFAIEYAAYQFFLIDRGSARGTTVAGKRVGGNRRGGRTELRNGDELIVGANTSPYIFRFEMRTQ